MRRNRLPRCSRTKATIQNNKNDPGGPTLKGVTQRVYDACWVGKGQTKRSVKSVTTDELNEIYDRLVAANGFFFPAEFLWSPFAVAGGRTSMPASNYLVVPSVRLPRYAAKTIRSSTGNST
ncbi:glycosyl hydrolase 108 family protein [Mesorhizobium sp. M0847]|uniref:glycosyl hydrolase 108 family protein n=1 Tax=unclassified Mesorhizobium TaxID=325217 RepID=UPI003336A47A